MDLLALKEKVGQTTPIVPHMQLMAMNVRSLILLHGQKLFKLTVPSACKYSATLVKQIVAISSVKSALDESKPHRNKHAQSVIRQQILFHHMRACGDC